jgi:hypothetical protein
VGIRTIESQCELHEVHEGDSRFCSSVVVVDLGASFGVASTVHRKVKKVNMQLNKHRSLVLDTPLDIYSWWMSGVLRRLEVRSLNRKIPFGTRRNVSCVKSAHFQSRSLRDILSLRSRVEPQSAFLAHLTRHLSHQSSSNMPPRKLELTQVEANLRRLLLDVASYINSESPSKLRFSGGWVRDKLLGVGSHDIDVAIDNMTGYQFGLKMKEYLEQPGTSDKYGLDGVATTEANAKSQSAATVVVAGLHKIEANPEKSKHLETVTTRIFGLDIDLVNLRKETYTEDSRNPQMEFGTPEEDALRRDATINAMFYNLTTEAVEDFTGQGHDDMRDKILRTPLEPYQTFKDDPLRVLRLIRFASRLDYEIDEAAKKAMSEDSVKEALKVKISRERVGVEVEKMLKG